MRQATASERFISHLIIISIAFVMLYPILWLLGSSFKPEHMIFTDGVNLWPREWKFDNYVKGWQGVQGNTFGHFLSNSLFISIAAVIGTVISCAMAAYAFARLDFIGNKLLFALMLITIMLPHHVTLIPQYLIFNYLGWVNTFNPLIIPKWLATDAFFIFLIVQFIRGLPRELDEAAIIDGCGPWQVFWRVIVPLAVPALITTIVFTFLWTWDDFFSQLLYLNEPSKFTVQLGLRLFIDPENRSEWGAMFAMSVLSLIPCFAVFMFFQRYFVQGIATTGLKG